MSTGACLDEFTYAQSLRFAWGATENFFFLCKHLHSIDDITNILQ